MKPGPKYDEYLGYSYTMMTTCVIPVILTTSISTIITNTFMFRCIGKSKKKTTPSIEPDALPEVTANPDEETKKDGENSSTNHEGVSDDPMNLKVDGDIENHNESVN